MTQKERRLQLEVIKTVKKWNFIYKQKLIDVYAETFEEAEIIAEQIMKELDLLEQSDSTNWD